MGHDGLVLLPPPITEAAALVPPSPSSFSLSLSAPLCIHDTSPLSTYNHGPTMVGSCTDVSTFPEMDCRRHPRLVREGDACYRYVLTIKSVITDIMVLVGGNTGVGKETVKVLPSRIISMVVSSFIIILQGSPRP